MPARRDPLVKILLCVHNGELYLDELVASVRAQQYVNWQLLVCDDGSSDGSMAIVDRHVIADERIIVVEQRPVGASLGPSKSFMHMLEHVGGDELFAFCDQDDVWFPHKLSWTVDAVGALRVAQSASGAAGGGDIGGRSGEPDRVSDLVVVSTDAEVTDAELNVTSPSALTQHQVGAEVTFGRLLVNNVAIGATLVGTGAVAREALRMSQGLDIRMHDWWCALIAAYGGSFAVLGAATMSWRRHGATVTGREGGTVSERVERRLQALTWSVEAARALREQLGAVDAVAQRAAASLDGVDGAHPSVNDLRRMRRAGVAPWSRAHAANLVVAAVLSK